MTNDKIIQYLAIVFLGLFAACSTSQKEKEQAESTVSYTCPMHPQVIKDGPGTCPVCAMDLVPVSASAEGSRIMLSASQIQLANIKTQVIQSDVFQTSKVLDGRLMSNADRAVQVSAKYPGRVEKMFVRETGQPVKKGQPLFQIYSEEIQTLQRDYLLQVNQVAAFPGEEIYGTLLEAAESKLALLGFSKAQIHNLRIQRNTSPLVVVYSPTSGIVNEINIAEGQYVAEGAPVMGLEDFSELWVEADVYPNEASSIRLNMPMKVSIDPQADEQYVRVDFISPQVDPLSQVVKIRGTIKNNGSLQPGMNATVLLPDSERFRGISVPLDAVIREEGSAHVWIKTGKNTFEPRKVLTGNEDAERIIIISGLEDVKEVVTSGAYLLTSEFVLKKGKDPIAAHQH